MKKRYMDILINIIGAVESGGQVYGERDYAAYAGKGANSPNEKTCTLGWAQNYGNNGRRLCQMVYEKDPAVFKKADTAGIARKLQTDWERTGWDPTEKERKALIAIITTRVGKRCQDALFAELMESYLKDAKAFGVRDVRAKMMWCEIQHLGGLAPVKRIFARAVRPYTPDSILASLLLDQQDTSNDNQVGDKKFQKRHECCVRWIRQYLPEKDQKRADISLTERQIRQKAIAPMQGWIGLSRATGTHHPIIDLYNSFRPLPRGYAVTYQDDYCATTVSAAGIKAGLTDIIPRECGCGQMIELFREKGRWMERDDYIPDMGDVIFYDWDDTGAGDCTGWPEHVGMVEKVSTGIITAIEGNMDGGIVGRRQIALNARYIRGYGIPDYASKATTESVSVPEDKKTVDILAAEVIAGIWGHGDERRERLTAAGYDYDAVQDKVNGLLR